MTHSHSSEEGQPPPHPHFKRDKWATIRGGPSSWSEWTIRLEDIELKERILTRGGFCNNIVRRGYWHQDVAVKFLGMDHVEDEKQLETFKKEAKSPIYLRLCGDLRVTPWSPCTALRALGMYG